MQQKTFSVAFFVGGGGGKGKDFNHFFTMHCK